MKCTKILQQMLSGLLALLGFTGCQFAMEYGPPPVEYKKYKVYGVVTDLDRNPLKDIEVRIDNKSKKDVIVYTNSSGYFESPLIDSGSLSGQVEFVDVDGEANGGEFESKKISLTEMRKSEKDQEIEFGAYVYLLHK